MKVAHVWFESSAQHSRNYRFSSVDAGRLMVVRSTTMVGSRLDLFGIVLVAAITGCREQAPPPPSFALDITGFGVTMTPTLPIAVAHLDNGTLIFGSHVKAAVQLRDGDLKNVIVKPGEKPTGVFKKFTMSEQPLMIGYSTGQAATTQLALAPGMSSYDALITDVRTVDSPAEWTIITNDFTIRWPAMFTLRGNGVLAPGSRSFELGWYGWTESMMWLQGPLTGAEIPTPESLAAPGMLVSARGDEVGTVNNVTWVEYAYQHDNVLWRQRTYWIPHHANTIYVLRAQSRVSEMAKVFPAATLVAISFRPRR